LVRKPSVTYVLELAVLLVFWNGQVYFCFGTSSVVCVLELAMLFVRHCYQTENDDGLLSCTSHKSHTSGEATARNVIGTNMAERNINARSASMRVKMEPEHWL
jgi:hypothetical protein